MKSTSALVGGVVALVVASTAGCSTADDDADARASTATTPDGGRHHLEAAPAAFGTWERATTRGAAKTVEDLVAESEAEGDEASGGAYSPLDPAAQGGRSPEAFVLYVGIELGHDDVSTYGPQAYIENSAEQLGVDLTMLPTRSPLGGALGCGSAEHQGVPQVACFWAAAGVTGTVIYNLDSPRSLRWAAAQTRELRSLVERDGDQSS